MANCSRKGCRRVATHHVVFLAWPVGAGPRTTGLEVRLPDHMCQQCAANLQPAVVERAWSMIVARSHERGLRAPDPATVRYASKWGVPMGGDFKNRRRATA